MPCKQVYKITYPNGKIYVGMDLTGTLTYFGTPSAKAKERIVADLDAQRLDLTVRKEILWESETASDARNSGIGSAFGNTPHTSASAWAMPMRQSRAP